MALVCKSQKIFMIIKFMVMNKFKSFIDQVLLINLFLVIIFAFFFMFSVIMEINGVSIYLDLFRKIWNPLITPLITLLILSSLWSGINSWLKKRGHFEE